LDVVYEIAHVTFVSLTYANYPTNDQCPKVMNFVHHNNLLLYDTVDNICLQNVPG